MILFNWMFRSFPYRAIETIERLNQNLGMGEHQKVRVSSKLKHVMFHKVRVSSELEHLMFEHIRVRASLHIFYQMIIAIRVPFLALRKNICLSLDF